MKNSPYHHLVGDVPADLPTDKCIYLDGTSNLARWEVIVEAALSIFEMFDMPICQIVLKDETDSTFKARSLKWLSEYLARDTGATSRNLKYLSFFPNRRKTIDETWRPEIYLSVESRVIGSSIFFSSRSVVEHEKFEHVLGKMNKICSFCAGYIFDFPTVFSPLAYHVGITVDPSDKAVGKYGHHEAKRLENWRDNSQIGILSEGKRNFYDPCGGFVRDVYPIMILDASHNKRKIDGQPIFEYLSLKFGALIRPFDEEHYLIEIPGNNIKMTQRLLDQARITLSGGRL